MKENNIKSKNVKTYAEDMAKTIKSGEGGIIKKIIHEQEEQEAEKKNLSPESKKNKLFMLVSVALIVLAFLTIVSIVVFRQKIFTVAVAPQFVPIIFTDQNKFLEIGGLNKDKIIQTVLNEMNTAKIKVGGIEGIYLANDKNPVLLREFVKLIGGSFVPGQTIFVSDNFLLGVVNNKAKDLFILLKVRSFADIFDGMKAWENKMFYDLHGFFDINITSDTNYLLTKNFEDGIVENKNARILYDKDNKIVLMYVFADENSVIITNTSEAVREIMLRLVSSQIKK